MYAYVSCEHVSCCYVDSILEGGSLGMNLGGSLLVSQRTQLGPVVLVVFEIVTIIQNLGNRNSLPSDFSELLVLSGSKASCG